MTVGRYLVLHVPPLVLGTVVVLVSVALSIAGLLIVRRFISDEHLKPHNDVAGFFFGTMGVIYAVLLAFTVIVVWGNFEKAKTNVDIEASCIADLFRNISQLDRSFANEACPVMVEYVNATVTYDWQATSRGEISPRMFDMQSKLWRLLGSYSPKTKTEEVFFTMAVQKLNDLCDVRRMRLLASRAGVNAALWWVLIIGGIITVVFTFLFGSENLRTRIIMTALLSTLISLILFTVLEFNYPFSGNLSISSQPITNNLRFFSIFPPSGQERMLKR